MTALFLLLAIFLGYGMREAERARKLQRLHAYASDMKAAQVALDQHNRGLAVDLLRRYLSKAGEEDLRGLEWRYLWQESKSDEFRSFPHGSMVHGAALSAEGRFLVTTGHDGKAQVWETASARRIREFGATGFVQQLSKHVGFSPNGKWIAFAGEKGVEIRDFASGNLVQQLKSTGPPLLFSPNGRWLVVQGANGTEVWNLSNWTHLTLTNTYASHNNLAFTPDGFGLVFVDTYDDRLRSGDLRTGTTKVIGTVNKVRSLAVSPDGKWLASGDRDGVVQLWDWAARQAVKHFRAHPGMVYGLAFSPDSKLLATGGNDQLIHLWETGTTNRVATYQGHEAEIWSLDFSKDGQFLVSASEDGTAKLWSVRSGPPRTQSFALSPDSIPIGLLPDGSALVAKDKGQAVTRLWSLPDGQVIRSNTWHQIEEFGCASAIFLPANQRVVGVSTNATVHW